MTFCRALSAGFGAGAVPRAPGTAGSLLGLFLGAGLLTAGHLPLLFGCIVIVILGTYAISTLPEATLDPGWVVIDEIAGQMIVLLGLSHLSVLGLILAFALFRFFDIIKPGPVGWLDARHDAYGVMGDDVVAGGLGLICMWGLRTVMPL